MQKQHSWPEGHWNWPIAVTHKHGLRCGDMVWFGGQVNLSPQGDVLNPGDLQSQTKAVMHNINRVLAEFNVELDDLTNLTCFYVNHGEITENEFLHMVADGLPATAKTAVTAVATPYLCYDNLCVEIEGVAMRKSDGEKLIRDYAPNTYNDNRSEKFCDAIRCGKMIFVSAQSAMDNQGNLIGHGKMVEQSNQLSKNIQNALSYFGAGFDDVVKTNRWYCGGDDIEDFEPAALSFAANFSEPGPAATGIPIPRHADARVLIKIAVIAMLGENGEHLPRRHVWPESLWDWHVHLPYKHGLKCDNMIFLGGQVSLDKHGRAVNPGNLSAQTHQAMAHIKTILNELGADYANVCKVMTVYKGDVGEDALHQNLPIRSSYFDEPGPPTTGVPLPVLAYENMCIEIDIYAMADPD